MNINKISESVLIIDDERTNLALLERLLQEMHCTVKTALSGAHAFDILESHTPALILLDVVMPDMDGYEVCSRLKSQESTMDIPIIFVSAMDDHFNKVKAFEIGAVDYITKPIHFEELKARVSVHLELAFQRKLLIQQTFLRDSDSIFEEKNRVKMLQKEVNALSMQLGQNCPYKEV